MGLGAFPASDQQFLGMLGMHGTYEANLAMYDCDVMINIGARFDDRITGKLDRVLARIPRRSTSTSTAPRSTRTCGSTCRSSAMRGDVLEELIRRLEGEQPRTDHKALKAWWAQIDEWRGRNCLAYKQDSEIDQAAIRARAALSSHQGPRPLHHHRGRPAPDVGGAVPEVREAQPLDDLGRARHHGLRPAGGHRRADRPSRRARHRRRRRGLDHDEHPGDVDGRRSTACR